MNLYVAAASLSALLAISTLSTSAFANSDCDKLAAEWNRGQDENDIVSSEEFDFGSASAGELTALADSKKQQIIFSANDYLSSSGSHARGTTVDNVVDAAASMRRDRIIRVLSFKKITVDYVEHSPGDNLFGFVFKKGTTQLIARTSDDGMECEN